MAYNNQQGSRTGNYQNQRKAFTNAGAGATGGAVLEKSEPILEKLMRPSKSGKSIATFTIGDEDLVIPANTRVVVSALSEKQMAGLKKSRETKGFLGAVPTHKLVVFPITEQKK